MKAALLVALALAAPATAQRPNVPKATTQELNDQLAKGESLEARVDGDLNGDGQIDTVFVGRGEDRRTLYVMLAYRSEVDLGHDPASSGPLDPYPLGSAEMAIAKGVLTVKDLVGGTTATAATYRLRYEPAARKLRLIGLDAKLYSRTWAHDGAEASWNLLTGDRTRRVLKLRAPGGPYVPGPLVKSRRVTKPVYLENLPEADSLTG